MRRFFFTLKTIDILSLIYSNLYKKKKEKSVIVCLQTRNMLLSQSKIRNSLKLVKSRKENNFIIEFTVKTEIGIYQIIEKQ